ncbi:MULTISPECIES: phosphate signaling complex PhoU family protein [Nocardia]|uniref:hypothetical protein n=1 Tax=Nocardia TaxID=1817 RepID=UPI001E33E5E0|nr:MULTISPECIES: hypothetical protein [Nocardia]
MGAAGIAMATTTAQILGSRDPVAAAGLERRDDLMDELLATTAAPDWPGTVAAAADATLLGRYYERFADHTVHARSAYRVRRHRPISHRHHHAPRRVNRSQQALVRESPHRPILRALQARDAVKCVVGTERDVIRQLSCTVELSWPPSRACWWRARHRGTGFQVAAALDELALRVKIDPLVRLMMRFDTARIHYSLHVWTPEAMIQHRSETIDLADFTTVLAGHAHDIRTYQRQ